MRSFTLLSLAISFILAGTVSAFPAFQDPEKFAKHMQRAIEENGGKDPIAEVFKRASESNPSFSNFNWNNVTIPSIETLLSQTPGNGFGHRSVQSIIPPDAFLYDYDLQHIDLTSDAHKYIPPGPNDLRGPCPGLNVLANHGYISRSGVTNFFEATAASTLVFGVGPELSALLQAVAVVFNGNILDLSYSIGGPPPIPADLGALSSILLGSPGGLNAHNLYEGDASAVRQDYYAPGANYDNYNLHMPYFMELLQLGNFDSTPGKDVYNVQTFLKHKSNRWHQSVETNPLFFSTLFAGAIVSTSAERFAAEFASNNTKDEFGFNRIYLDEANLLPFFGVTKDSNGQFHYTPGTEHLDPTWVRRPLPSVFEWPDLILNIIEAGLIDPNLISVGGNMGKVNTFTGLDLGNLVGGVVNVQELLENPQYLACLIYQVTVEEVVPSQLNIIYKSTGQALNFLQDNYITPMANFANAGDNPCINYSVKSNHANIYAQFPGSNITARNTNQNPISGAFSKLSSSIPTQVPKIPKIPSAPSFGFGF